MGETLSGAELVFAKRMLPHVKAGKSFDEAARAVLSDDARLIMAAFKRGASRYFPTADERGMSRHSGEQIGDVITREISRAVHQRLIPA